MTDAPEAFARSQLRGIVGFRLPIARLDGKAKSSQNCSAEDRAGVVAGLRAEDRSRRERGRRPGSTLIGMKPGALHACRF